MYHLRLISQPPLLFTLRSRERARIAEQLQALDIQVTHAGHMDLRLLLQVRSSDISIEGDSTVALWVLPHVFAGGHVLEAVG